MAQLRAKWYTRQVQFSPAPDYSGKEQRQREDIADVRELLAEISRLQAAARSQPAL